MLYLPAVGIIIAVIVGLINVNAVLAVIPQLYSSSGTNFAYGLLVIVMTFASLAVATVAAWNFFQHKKRTKYVMVVYYLFGLLYVLVGVILPAVIYGMPLDRVGIGSIFGALVGVVGWLPYFLLSKRVPVVFSR
ncbi:hypothetical protein SOASR031_09860 [Leminorella grimontii]|nr:hypothetical protein SOASR031_09860 [Leminorella grimontii]